jgi:hypothetical protein
MYLKRPFLGTFAKLRKATVGFVLSVRLSSWKNSAPSGRFFYEVLDWSILTKSVEKIRFSKI